MKPNPVRPMIGCTNSGNNRWTPNGPGPSIVNPGDGPRVCGDWSG